jgi:hypothetical protein
LPESVNRLVHRACKQTAIRTGNEDGQWRAFRAREQVGEVIRQFPRGVARCALGGGRVLNDDETTDAGSETCGTTCKIRGDNLDPPGE